jgi:hypothetical protein
MNLRGCKRVKPETREYILGERNAIRDEFILSRERAGNAEYVNVTLPGEQQPIYSLWTQKPQKYKATEATGEIVKNPPKHTGGRRPYIMLMQDQQDVLNVLTLDAAGLLLKLIAGGFIDWHTGRIVDRRTKQPLTSVMMRTRYKLGATKIKAMIKELTKNEVIKYDRKQKAYILNAKFARKGVGGNADKV